MKVDEITRLQILEKYANLARLEIEGGEENSEDNGDENEMSNLSIEDLDDEEMDTLKKSTAENLQKIAEKRNAKAYAETEERYLKELKALRATGHAYEIPALREKYARQGFVYGVQNGR